MWFHKNDHGVMAIKFTHNEWSKDCVENEYVLLILNSVHLLSHHWGVMRSLCCDIYCQICQSYYSLYWCIVCHDKNFWRNECRILKVCWQTVKYYQILLNLICKKKWKKNIYCCIVMWAETLLSILSLLIRLLMLVNSSSDNTSVSSNLLSQA